MLPVSTDGLASSVGLSVTTVNPAKVAEPIMIVQDVDSGGPKQPCVRWGPCFHTWMGNFEGKKVPAQDVPRHVWQSIISKRLSRGSTGMVWIPVGVHIGAIWQIQLNHLCAPAMWPYVKLLSPLVILLLWLYADAKLSILFIGKVTQTIKKEMILMNQWRWLMLMPMVAVWRK